MIRSVWVVVASAAITGFFASIVVVGGWLPLVGSATRCDCIPRIWVRLVLRCAGVRLDLSGAEAVDWSRPAVVVVNHQSWFDVFALIAALPGRVRFVAKQELGRIPIFGRAWRGCGHIALDRGDRRQAIESLNRAGEKMHEESLAVTMFPEGTRSPDGRLYPFKKGAFVLAIRAGVPIVPIGMSGSGAVMPKGSFRVRSGEIRIRVGSPIEVAGRGHAERDALSAECRRAVAALAGAVLAERRPAPPGGGEAGARGGGGEAGAGEGGVQPVGEPEGGRRG